MPFITVAAVRVRIAEPEPSSDGKRAPMACRCEARTHGFTTHLIIAHVREGLAAIPAEQMVRGGRKMIVLVLRITQGGRKALDGGAAINKWALASAPGEGGRRLRP